MAKHVLLLVLLAAARFAGAQTQHRTASGVVVTAKDEAVVGVSVVAAWTGGELRAVTNDSGEFSLEVPAGQPVVLRFEGRNIRPVAHTLAGGATAQSLRIEVEFVIPRIHETMVILASGLEPAVELRNDEVYRKALFSRDDQLLMTLNSGINAGQHEGGGKSLEIRRFGFNLDHGGVNGGLKVLVDNVQQNQGTQGHGQGYLGALKTLTPELVEQVNVLNGPFSAEYGDFSGLGVVHILTRERMPDTLTLRIQGGSFGSARTFTSYSPSLRHADGLLALESSRSDGPFLSPSRYRRDNVTGNYTRYLREGEALGFKFNAGRNDFFSSGQIPLDLVGAGELDRFGTIDPTTGGRIRMGTAAAYYRRTSPSGGAFKADGFVSRSLFDLFSNFTLFANDPIHGDGIQQHDSRAQQGINTQALIPGRWFGQASLLTAGANFHSNQILVGLFPQTNRRPSGVWTLANARVVNGAGYVQQSTELGRTRLKLDLGLRWDAFQFRLTDRAGDVVTGSQAAARLQPKLGLSWRPSRVPGLTLSYNYGRGINTPDARGVVQRPDAPRIGTTDFQQVGLAFQAGRLSLAADGFLIDRSNEQVYVPDDGSFELLGSTRAHGYEVKSSLRLSRRLSVDGGLTQVTNAFYRGTSPREYVDSAPHTVGNAALTLSGWHGVFASLRYRHVSNYRLDPVDASIRASGLDVLDLAITKPLRRWVDLNIDVDNLANKRYYETQNYFESRVTPGAELQPRVHGTPGYPISLTVGMTFRLFAKEP